MSGEFQNSRTENQTKIRPTLYNYSHAIGLYIDFGVDLLRIFYSIIQILS